MVPFGYLRRNVIILPVLVKNNKIELITSPNQPEIITSNLSEHLVKVEEIWRTEGTQNAKEGNMTVYDRLNFQKDLTSQNPNSEFIVLYISSGTYLASCLVKPKEPYSVTVNNSNFEIKGFFADHTTYYYNTNIEEEAYYLCSILNSRIIDNIIKPIQARGSFGGPRHIHKIPLSYPIPKYDPDIRHHKQLAEDARICERKVVNNILPRLSFKSIGKIRGIIRKEISTELERIDTNVKLIINQNAVKDVLI